MKSGKLKSIDLNLLKVFAAIYSMRNLTRAGEQLAISQPAVSRSLERLHHHFKERLFYRAEGEMRPTRTAEIIAPFILESLALLDAAAAITENLDQETLDITLKLGGNDYVSAVILPSLMALIRRRAPAVFLTTVPCSYADAANLIHRDAIDCAITSSLPRGERIASHPLFREDYVVIACADHPLLGGADSIDLKTYLSCDHILVSYRGNKNGWVDERLAEMGYKRRVIGATHMFLAIPHIIKKQLYLCTLPRRLAKQFANAHAVRIYDLPFTSHSHLFHLVWPRHQSKNPISTWMRDQIIETCQNLCGSQGAG